MGRTSKYGVPKKKQLEGKDLEISKNIVDCINAEMQKRNIKYDSKLLEGIEEATGQKIEGSRFSLIRNHQVLPSITEINALADYFKISTDSILGRDSNIVNSDIENEPTAADILRSIFNLRKIADISFSKTSSALYPSKTFTAVYFDHHILVDAPAFDDSLTFFINDAIEEWEQLMSSTLKMKLETQETLLRLWEEDKLKTAEDISLDFARSFYKYSVLENKYTPCAHNDMRLMK